MGSPYQPHVPNQHAYGAGAGYQINHQLSTSMAISDHSMGGMTSKRSHKHLLDTANQPMLSKQETESLYD